METSQHASSSKCVCVSMEYPTLLDLSNPRLLVLPLQDLARLEEAVATAD